LALKTIQNIPENICVAIYADFVGATMACSSITITATKAATVQCNKYNKYNARATLLWPLLLPWWLGVFKGCDLVAENFWSFVMLIYICSLALNA